MFERLASNLAPLLDRQLIAKCDLQMFSATPLTMPIEDRHQHAKEMRKIKTAPAREERTSFTATEARSHSRPVSTRFHCERNLHCRPGSERKARFEYRFGLLSLARLTTGGRLFRNQPAAAPLPVVAPVPDSAPRDSDLGFRSLTKKRLRPTQEALALEAFS